MVKGTGLWMERLRFLVTCLGGCCGAHVCLNWFGLASLGLWALSGVY